MARKHYSVIPFVAPIKSSEGKNIFRLWPSVTCFNLMNLPGGNTYLVNIDPDPFGTAEAEAVTAVVTLHEDWSLSFLYQDPSAQASEVTLTFDPQCTRMYRGAGGIGEEFRLDSASTELMSFVYNCVLRRTTRRTS